MTTLSVNKPFETDVPSLVVDNKLAVGAHQFRLVVVGASGVPSDPFDAVVQIVEGKVVNPVTVPPITIVTPTPVLTPISPVTPLKVARPASVADTPAPPAKAAKKATKKAAAKAPKTTPAAKAAKKTTKGKKATKPTTKRRGDTE